MIGEYNNNQNVATTSSRFNFMKLSWLFQFMDYKVYNNMDYFDVK